jgi:hypothetical protein
MVVMVAVFVVMDGDDRPAVFVDVMVPVPVRAPVSVPGDQVEPPAAQRPVGTK